MTDPTALGPHLECSDAATLALLLARSHRDVTVGRVIRLATYGIARRTVEDSIEGAGFRIGSASPPVDPEDDEIAHWVLSRRRSLADTVAPGMTMLTCGLNPSEYAADVGVGFARPGNRFWPAALAAGLVRVDRDPFAALDAGVGMTDLVKRATPRADVLTTDEYTRGLARVERLVRRFTPGVVCFIGLAGWRAAADPKADAGPISQGVGGQPAWLMPSTSGANAGSSLADLTEHLRAAAALATAQP